MTKQEIINEFIEKGADLEHARWAKWQKYMFSKMNYTEQEIDGKIVAFYVLPADLWERWNRQIDTPYSALSEQEKDSDRKQTKEYLPLLEKSLTEFEQAVREEVIDSEIKYWTDIFDNRPQDRDLESDTIAQNFARIEIERLTLLKN